MIWLACLWNQDSEKWSSAASVSDLMEAVEIFLARSCSSPASPSSSSCSPEHHHTQIGLTILTCVLDSVADPVCLSRILIFTHPGSRISDPGSKNSNKREGWKKLAKQQQKRGVKKISCHNFLCSHKFHKIANYFSFDVLKKKIWANFQRIIELFTQKFSISSQKYGFGIRDPRSGIRKKPIPDSGSRGQKVTGSRIRIRNTGFG